MLPPSRLHLQTRLCAACYAETSVHQAVWQRTGKVGCDRHALRLLSVCPVCKHGFRTPALWNDEYCEGCGLAFGQMQSYQESIRKRGQSTPSTVSPDELDGRQ